MTSKLKIMCLSVAMLAPPAFAQTDPHAGHHPASQATAPTAPPDVKPSAQSHCAMMAAQPHTAGGAQPMGGMPMQASPDKDMMSGGMSADMMKKCMADHAAAPADHPHGN